MYPIITIFFYSWCFFPVSSLTKHSGFCSGYCNWWDIIRLNLSRHLLAVQGVQKELQMKKRHRCRNLLWGLFVSPYVLNSKKGNLSSTISDSFVQERTRNSTSSSVSQWISKCLLQNSSVFHLSISFLLVFDTRHGQTKFMTTWHVRVNWG